MTAPTPPAAPMECPFCGKPLTRRSGINDYGRCDTPNCWMHERAMVVPVDDPVQVAAWNTRTPPHPASQPTADERENAVAIVARLLAKHENGERYEGFESTHRELAERINEALAARAQSPAAVLTSEEREAVEELRGWRRISERLAVPAPLLKRILNLIDRLTGKQEPTS